MAVEIREVRLFRVELETRMPFRYGIATVTRLPHLFVRLVLRVDGGESVGLAADHLAPKWFTKNPDTTPEADIAEMLDVIRRAKAFAEGRAARTPFALWKELYDAQAAWGAAQGLAPLLTNFGVSLVERAMIDAYCRARGETFSELLRGSEAGFGIELGRVYPELEGRNTGEYLPSAPLGRIVARHTVGLSDPLTEAEITDENRVGDGLPQSLEASIRAYGLRHFKLKIGGDPAADAERVGRIFAVVASSGVTDWAYTLDGNESYQSVADLQAFVDLLPDAPSGGRLLFVEQPFHRAVALSNETGDALNGWPGYRPRIIIDESDGAIGDLPRALERGYAGTSHKNCKGVFKGIANACLCYRRGALLSGEDLSNVGPVALPQDLAVQASLGIESVERNGQHYFAGLSAFPETVQRAVLAAHPDLYRPSPAGFPTLAITAGSVDLTSVNTAPFGLAADFDPTVYEEV
jgi:L-alanine-DL-glutamate epimerase-like enolase superfamily enzyme